MRYYRIILCVEIIVGFVLNIELLIELKYDIIIKESLLNNGFFENNVVFKIDNFLLELIEVLRDIFKFNKCEGDKVFKKKEFKEVFKFYKNVKEYMVEVKKSDFIDMFCNLVDCF